MRRENDKDPPKPQPAPKPRDPEDVPPFPEPGSPSVPEEDPPAPAKSVAAGKKHADVVTIYFRLNRVPYPIYPMIVRLNEALEFRSRYWALPLAFKMSMPHARLLG